MLTEKYAIYCFSLEDTKFAQVDYKPTSNLSIGEVVHQAAWVNLKIQESPSKMPEKFTKPPESFTPKLVAYSDFSEIGKENYISNVSDNIIVVLMPTFPVDKLEILEMILGQRYGSYLKSHNILIKSPQEQLLELKPGWFGISINLKAVWQKLTS